MEIDVVKAISLPAVRSVISWASYLAEECRTPSFAKRVSLTTTRSLGHRVPIAALGLTAATSEHDSLTNAGGTFRHLVRELSRRRVPHYVMGEAGLVDDNSSTITFDNLPGNAFFIAQSRLLS